MSTTLLDAAMSPAPLLVVKVSLLLAAAGCVAALLDITSTPLSDAEYRRLSSLLKRVREQGDER